MGLVVCLALAERPAVVRAAAAPRARTGFAGVVVDQGSSALFVPDATVLATDGRGHHTVARTDQAGRFRMPLAAGRYRVLATAPGDRHSHARTVTVRRDRFTCLVLEVARSSPPPTNERALRGIVLQEMAQFGPYPIAGAVVEIERAGHLVDRIITDANGSFRAMVPPGRYEILVAYSTRAGAPTKSQFVTVSAAHATTDASVMFGL